MIIMALVAFYNFTQITVKVRQKESQVMSIGISNAVEQFQADYGRLPLPASTEVPGNDMDMETSPDQDLVAILAGKEEELPAPQNPRGVDYLEGIKPAKSGQESGRPWLNGLLIDPASGKYGIVDNWGKPFRLRLDTNNDKSLANPNPDQTKAGRTPLPKRVLVWSAGKDGKWETWDDNPQSWQ